MFDTSEAEPASAVTERQDYGTPAQTGVGESAARLGDAESVALTPGSDADDWAPMEPVAPPSDIAVAVIALLPVWCAAAWVIYTLLR